MTNNKDYYGVLGVDEKASRAEIKAAYKQLAKKYFPDVNRDDPTASRKFVEINEAHSVLSDPDKRKKYDQMRRMGSFGFRPSARPGFEDLNVGNFSDIFASIFDQRRAPQPKKRRESPRRGADVQYDVEVAFLTAAVGGKVSISLPITEPCAPCQGSGAGKGAKWTRCAECRGKGTVSFGQGGFAMKRPCPACFGKGTRPDSACAACGGAAEVHQKRNLQVVVPAGTETSSRLRIPGQGERGENGGPPGDVIITFKVLPHESFRRDGLDIQTKARINLAQAVLGSRLGIETIHGKRLTVRIPAGTQPGTRFRLRGHGVRKKGRAGDHYVEVRVSVPKKLESEQTLKFRRFADAAGLER